MKRHIGVGLVEAFLPLSFLTEFSKYPPTKRTKNTRLDPTFNEGWVIFNVENADLHN
ncbi:hypothetical protein [Capnocytophaga canimorsus]|uniref:hypothetical protein n=1 Tax=Capnocytophaga canimorsus TaxID=28188 RepID=UPI0037D437F7